MNSNHIFGASKRALAASQGGPAWAMMMKVKALPEYDAEKAPFGLINLSGAENGLMKDWLDDFVESSKDIMTTENSLSYGAISGSEPLRVSMAAFFNQHFSPHTPVQSKNILVANGVTSLIDLIAWSLCDVGDGVVYLTPNFYMLNVDLTLRSGVVPVPVSCSKISDPFKASCAESLAACLEDAIDAAVKRGVECRVLFICNPANPQGRCYSKGTLISLKEMCARRGMHLVSDEIYAMSQFQPPTSKVDLDGFTSVLNLPSSGKKADTLQNVHCLYGLSKDFGMGGLRMAFLVTRNDEVLDVAKRVAWFTWISSFSSTLVEQLMSEPKRVQEYMTIYRSRLSQAYCRTSSALTEHGIPFEHANSSLFVSIDLSGWLHYFPDSRFSARGLSREIQLCEFLTDHGVFLNAGEFAGDDRPGRFRLVFTGGDIEAVVLAIQRLRRALNSLEESGNRNSNESISCASTICDEKAYGTSWDKEKGNINQERGSMQRKLHRLTGKLNCFK